MQTLTLCSREVSVIASDAGQREKCAVIVDQALQGVRDHGSHLGDGNAQARFHGAYRFLDEQEGFLVDVRGVTALA